MSLEDRKTAPSIPGWLTGFVDDAAIYPPGNLPLDRAVAAHREHQRSEYAAMVGSFVVSDLKIPDLIDLMDERDDDDPLAVTVVVTGGAGAIEPAVRWASRAATLRLVGVECALRDEDDLGHNARRICSMLDSLEEELAGVDVFVEPPRVAERPSHGWLAAADELAMRELPLKFRTGGATADAFPSPAELATCIVAALDREVPFKCTAGLHHAVRHTDPATGLTHHGFLNVLAATSAGLDGRSVEEALAVEEADAVVADLDSEALGRARDWFKAFGSCSILEPHDDLVELGLLAPDTGVAS